MHGNEIVQYLQNYKHHEFDQGHSTKLSRVLQVTSKWKSVKQAVYFLKAIEFWPTFDIQVDITLYFGKSCKTTPFRTPTETYQNTSTLISIALPIPKQQPCKNMRNLCFFGGSFFKWKNCWHLEFLMNQIFGQRFIVFKKNEV